MNAIAALVVSAILSGCASTIHDDVQAGDLKAVRAHLEADPGLLEARLVASHGGAGQTPLHTAAAFKQLEIACLLLDLGADPNAEYYGWGTPLHEAAQRFGASEDSLRSAAPLVDVLLDYGALIDSRMQDGQGPTPLLVACESANWNAAAILLARGANPGLRSYGGRNALLLTAARPDYVEHAKGRESFTRDLLDATGDVNSQGEDGDTALHWAAYHGNVELAALLIQRGARLEILNAEGVTALRSSRYNEAVLAFLLKQGANPNAVDARGETLLHLAAEYGYDESYVQLLLGFGADKEIVGQRGTAWELAQLMGHNRLTKLLR